MICKRRIGFEIRNLNNLIKRDIEKTHPTELDRAKGVHGLAIRYFYENSDKEIFQKDFEEFFSIRRSTATQILQLMEKNGLIIRENCANDGRKKRIILTERAVEIHKLIVNDIEKRENRMKQGISEKELESFYKTLDKIKANLEAEDVTKIS